MQVLRAMRVVLVAAALFPAAFAVAQTAPAADSPSIKIGSVLFTDLTYQQEPKTSDADGNSVSTSSFNVSRAYINVTGTLSKNVAFRVTPDIVRESGSGSSLSGSYTYRLKYAYGQYNLDAWTTKGSFVRFGMQQTPYIDAFESSGYKYRFMGPTFTDREGYAISSDLGVSGRWVFPGEWGEVHAGIYNGEGYAKSDPNDQKSFQARVSVSPWKSSQGFMNGLRLTAFVNADHYVKDAPRERVIVNAGYHGALISGAFEYLTAKDQPRASAAEVDSKGWSVYAAPHLPRHWDVLLRHDHVDPNDKTDATKTRNILGLVYWLPLEKVSSAISFDYEKVNYEDFDPARADEKRWVVHTMITF